MTDDGSPQPININIQTVCSSQTRTVTRATLNGDFQFQWAVGTTAIFEDASESGRMPGSSSVSSSSGTNSTAGGSGGGAPSRMLDPMVNCDLRADVSGYTSSRIGLYDREGQEIFDVGTITLHRISADEGRVVSILSLKAPKDAKKNFDKGTVLAAAKKPADAAASFEKAVASYPDYADAWLGLGQALVQMGSKEEAQGDFKKAMALDDKLVGPWQELGFLALDSGQWEESAHYLDHAVKLDPLGSAKAWYCDAVANYNVGRYDLAERSVRGVLKLERNPRAQYLLGLVLIARKDYKGGADALREYVGLWPNGEDSESAKKQISRVEGRSGN